MDTREFIESILKIILLFPGITVLAIFISKSLMLEPLRKRVDNWWPYAGYAVKCTLCLCGWFSFLSIVFYVPALLGHLFNTSWIVWGVNWFSPVNFLTRWIVLWGCSVVCYRVLWPFLEKHAPKMKIQWSSERRRRDHDDEIPFVTG